MKTLLQYFKVEKCDGEFGIEIEMEGGNLKEVNSTYWRTEDDPSLRGVYPISRAEYILKKPILLSAVKPSVEELNKQLEKAVPKFSFRTSCHVHVNVQTLSYKELMNFVYTYLLLEEPLMSLCGEGRISNRFCLRLQDAEGFKELLNKLFSSKPEDFIRTLQITRDRFRYSSINLEALSKYGSVEFRAMEGNMDAARISNWCNILHKLKVYALSMKSPKQIYEEYVKTSPDKFMKGVLGEYSKVFNKADFVKDIRKSFSLSLDLPFLYSESEEGGVFEERVEKADTSVIKGDWGVPVLFDDVQNPPIKNLAMERVIEDMRIARERAEAGMEGQAIWRIKAVEVPLVAKPPKRKLPPPIVNPN